MGQNSDEKTAQAFEAIFALVLAVEYWARALPRWSDLGPYYSASLPLVTLLCALSLSSWRRPAFFALAVIHGGVIWNEFPVAGNHAYLELVLCLLCASLDPKDHDEAGLLLGAAKWLVVVVLFYSGAQKLVHGYYFQGEMLSFSLTTNSFRPVLEPLISPEEFSRLIALRGQVGDGPYRVDSWLVLAVSNLVWLLELALPFFLSWRRTAVGAAWVALGLLLAIEVGAREVFFGLVFTNCLLLYIPGAHRRVLAPLSLLLIALLLSRLGILPDVTFY